MRYALLVILIAFYSFRFSASGDEKASTKTEVKKESHEGHGDEKSEPGEKHEEKEEENESVGPEKGIQESDEKKGFKLSPEALKNFEIKTVRLEKSSPWTLPELVIVRSGEEVNLFRLRDGFFKRIDFKQIKRMGSQVLISSPDLQSGDEIVSGGLGLLRIAELSAFGGLAEGHSH